MKNPTELAMSMLDQNATAIASLDDAQAKIDTRFKIATTAARLAECSKHTSVRHEWIGVKPAEEIST